MIKRSASSKSSVDYVSGDENRMIQQKIKKMFRSGGKFSQFKMIKEEKIIAIVVSFNFFLFCIWNKVRF